MLQGTGARQNSVEKGAEEQTAWVKKSSPNFQDRTAECCCEIMTKLCLCFEWRGRECGTSHDVGTATVTRQSEGRDSESDQMKTI